MKRTVITLIAFAVFVCGAISAAAQGVPIYNNIPNPLPGNTASVGYEATSTPEFGDQVAFGAGPRILTSVTVTMSSWGCQSGSWFAHNCVTLPGATFTHPLTINVYAVGAGNAVGALLGTKTQTVTIPYRPSADSINCVGSNTGKWYDAASNTCFNGKAANVTIDMSGLNLTLPENAIVSVAYNTSHYGYAPIGDSSPCNSASGGCPYDSLNVGTFDPALTLSAGTNPYFLDAYYSSSYAPNYCDGGSGGINVFRLDAGCWGGFKPALRVNASSRVLTKDDCKGNGWQTHVTASGATFPNQGQCIQYANTGK
jgi:hypothetical protein